MEEWKSQGLEIHKRIRPRTPPLAIKLVKDSEEIPDGALRPVKDFGGVMLMCQVWNMAREYGWTIGMTWEDVKGMCPAPVAFGWGELEDESDIAKAWIEFNLYSNREVAKKVWDGVPKFRKGEYAGMVVCPIEQAEMTPDVIMVYCNPAAAMVLSVVGLWKRGKRIVSDTDGIMSCTDSIIKAMVEGEPTVAIPGYGEKKWSRTQDDEMIFAIPRERLGEIIEGFNEIQFGYPMPIPPVLMDRPLAVPIKVNPPVPPPYTKMSWK
jgi:uncharacterized protein (DUF169 family)